MSSLGAAQTAVNAATQSMSSAGTIAGSANNGLGREKDSAEAQTAPQFGEVIQNIQAKYGARPEKGREIKKQLGKDDFLRIMITQMKNQDPTKPFDAEQMASQMAQFTTVEQLKNMNESMNKMTTANQPFERMAMTNMIGKTITVDRSRFPHTEGQNDALSFGLPTDAEKVTVNIISENGETIFTKDLGKMKAGEGQFVWDGKKINSLAAKAGNYLIRVDAQDSNGSSIETNPQTKSRVVGVSFEGAEPVFLVGDSQRQEKVTMKNIVRIDDMGGAQAPQAQFQAPAPAQGTSADAAKAKSAFFSFAKGVGSQNLDSPIAGYTGGPARELASAQSEAIARAKALAGGSAPEEKGFPNGLNDN